MSVEGRMLFLLAHLAAAQSIPVAVGDVFVEGPPGASVLLDGVPTGNIAPVTLPGVPAGPHVVGVRLGCQGGDTPVTVRAGAIERPAFVLAEGLGSLLVQVTPADAVVLVDGHPLVVDASGSTAATCGSHVVTGSAPGYAAGTLTVQVARDQRLEVYLPLEKLAVGAIAISVSPVDAEVRLDGEVRGVGPMTLDAVTAGTHQIEATKRGMIPVRQPVDVVMDSVVRVDLILVPQAPLAERLGLDRVRWGQVAGAGVLTLGGAGAGAASWLLYQRAVSGYTAYSELTYADEPDAYYQREVATPRTLAIASGVVGGLMGVGAGALWATLHLEPEAPGLVPIVAPTGVGVSGTF